MWCSRPRSLPALAALVLALGAGGRGEARSPEEIQVEVRIGWDWITLPASPGSAVRVARALDPSGRPFDATAGALGCRPADLRRALRLPKTDYLLGEPIVAELAVSVAGPGAWEEPVGGNYRAHGRDDNFRFLARAADGTWLADPYAPYPSFIGGGLGTTLTVTRGAPHSQWLAVQRWVALERPGVYDLYLVHSAHGHEVIGLRAALTAAIPARLRGEWTLEPDGYHLRDRRGDRDRWQMVPVLRDVPTPSPLVGSMPAALRERLGAEAAAVQDVAHVRVTVRAGAPAEVAAMVAAAERAAANPTERMPAGRADATREAIWFGRQEIFLPLLARWLRGRDRAWFAAGLAMNPSPAAARLLLTDASEEATSGLYYLAPASIPLAVPALVARLDAAEEGVRSAAEDHLRRWTGQTFGHTWEGYRRGRPTVAEGRRMQEAYAGWWATHGATFVPRRP